MTNNGKNAKRTFAKKVTSIVLYVDQVTQIQAIIESTGADKAAQVFRDLIDEALAARRRKTAQQLVLPDEPPSTQLGETLETTDPPAQTDPAGRKGSVRSWNQPRTAPRSASRLLHRKVWVVGESGRPCPNRGREKPS